MITANSDNGLIKNKEKQTIARIRDFKPETLKTFIFLESFDFFEKINNYFLKNNIDRYTTQVVIRGKFREVGEHHFKMINFQDFDENIPWYAKALKLEDGVNYIRIITGDLCGLKDTIARKKNAINCDFEYITHNTV